MARCLSRSLRRATVGVALALGAAVVASATTEAGKPAGPFPPIGDGRNLHNAHRVTDKVLSGAQPEGEAAFAELARLGVRTIISVDGATPDVQLASKHGLRYVHLPITYGGVTTGQGQ